LHPLESAAFARRTPFADVSSCSNTSVQKPDLLDHLVGAAEQRDREGEPESLGGLEIYDQVNFDHLLNWQIGGLCTMKDFSSVNTNLTICIGKTSAVGEPRHADCRKPRPFSA
jgi:hypothetical protein